MIATLFDSLLTFLLSWFIPPSSTLTTTYLYVGGPPTKVEVFGPSGGSAFRTVNFEYGPEGELLRRYGSTEEVRLTYTPVYNIATLKDGNNSGTTTYTYNTKLQLTDVKHPLWTSGNTDRVQYTSYDRAGRLLARTDGNGQETTYTYGSASTDDGLLTAVGYTGATSNNVSLTYDVFNRLTATTDAQGSSSTDYDDLGLVEEASRTYTGLSAKTFTYEYYPDGSRKTMVNTTGGWPAFPSHPHLNWVARVRSATASFYTKNPPLQGRGWGLWDVRLKPLPGEPAAFHERDPDLDRRLVLLQEVADSGAELVVAHRVAEVLRNRLRVDDLDLLTVRVQLPRLTEVAVVSAAKKLGSGIVLTIERPDRIVIVNLREDQTVRLRRLGIEGECHCRSFEVAPSVGVEVTVRLDVDEHP